MDLVTSSKMNMCTSIFKNKVVILFIFIIIFSIVYLFLDDKHFSGVNFIKDAIKEVRNIKAIGAILMHYLLYFLGFDFDRGMVFGVSGAIFGGWASSYLNKKK